MELQNPSRASSPLLNAAAYITTLAVFLVAILAALRESNEIRLAITVGLFIAFTIVESILMLTTVSLWQRRTLFLLQGIFAAASFFVLNAESGIAPVLFVVLAAQTLFSFDAPEHVLWSGGFIAAIFILLFLTVPPIEAALSSMVYAGVFAFMWAVARALLREQLARAESQRLASELEKANAQLRDYTARAQALAVAQERTRMAREIHDSLGHHLTVLSVQLQAAQKLIEREPARAVEQVETARGVVAQALQDVRQSVNALRQVSDADTFQIENLAQLVHEFGNATGLTTEYHAENFTAQRLTPAQALTVYRTVQEGLTNAQKHAHATHLDVRLTQNDDRLAVCITDNGNGSENRDTAPGYGLMGLRERVALLGGTLEAKKRTEGGFELRVELPLSQKGAST